MVGKYEVYETDFITTNIYNNPYISVNLSATFIGPTKTININGFWDGGNKWKVRMSPIEIGRWSYVTISNDPQLNGKIGSFDVSESSNKGFIKVNPNYPYSFMYDDGTPFLFLGDTQWGFNQYTVMPFNGTFQNYIDTRKAQGFTVIQTTLSPEYNTVGSEGGTGFTDITFNVLNPSYFQWLDKRIEYCVSKDITVLFWLCWSSVWNMGLNETKYNNYAKYIMARYSAYNIMVGVLGEYEEVSNVSGVRSAGQYIQSINPYKHPITTHTVNTTTDDFGYDSWINFHGQQQKKLTSSQYNSNIIRDRIYNKPVVQMEVCYETQLSEYGCIDPNEYRKAAWAVLTGGGYYVYGHNNIIGDAPNWTKLNSQGAKEMGYLLSFWSKTEFQKMSPKNNLVSSGYLLGTNQSGKEYVIYLPNGGSTTVDLASLPGILQLEWYNPRTGTYQGQTTVQGGAQRTFTSPDSNDWVLHIYCPIPSCDFIITII